MSDFHGEIETNRDWNRALGQCGCCPNPECQTPELDCQRQSLTLCAFEGPYDYYPDDSAPEPNNGKDSDSKSETCATFWRGRKKGCKIKGTNKTVGFGGKPTGIYTADYEISTTERFTDLWSIQTFTQRGCKPTISSVAAGTFSSKIYDFFQIANDSEQTSDTSDDPVIYGYFISREVSGTLENLAGQPDPLWNPRDSETEDDRPILPKSAQPFARTVTKTYKKEFNAKGILTGSSLQSTTTGFFRMSGCNAIPDDEDSKSESNPDDGKVIIINEYYNKIDCNIARSGLSDTDSIPWPTDQDSDSESYDGIDLDIATRPGCSALFECLPCGGRARAQRFRYRWKIPACHPGSYYRIDWDEVFFPSKYLDWYNSALNWQNPDSEKLDGIGAFDPNANPPPVLPTLTPKSWTWNGDALGDCPQVDSTPSDSVDDVSKEIRRRENSPSRRSPWSLTVLPPENGMVQILNARVYCVENPFGNKPQPIPSSTYNPDDVDRDGIMDKKEPVKINSSDI